MSITKAGTADIPELNVLVNSAYRGEESKKGWTTEAHLLGGIRVDEAMLINYIANPKVIILKNTDESGKITGSVYLEVRLPKLYVGMFSVSPVLQGKGLGRILLQAAEEYAKKLNCTILTMTVISTRLELISWYQRRGFNATGEIVPFPGDAKFGLTEQTIELIVMEKAVL